MFWPIKVKLSFNNPKVSINSLFSIVSVSGSILLFKYVSRLLTLVLSLSTTLTLTGCSEEKIKEELEIKKKIYMAEEVNQFPNKEYKIKNKGVDNNEWNVDESFI